MTIGIAIVGFGTIARAAHLPAIMANPAFRLAAIISHHGTDPGLGVPAFATVTDMLVAMPGEVDAICLCTPPRVRHAIAAEAIAAGLSVLLEKPPVATLAELEDIEAQAKAAGTCLYAAWHSQYAPAVAPAAALLKGETITRLAIDWRENVLKWHPEQDWIWDPDGFGVFDPGINALSIASAILPMQLFVEEAELLIPANRQAPIAAHLQFNGAAQTANFDWREQGAEAWSITAETASGRQVALHGGGARLVIDGAEQELGPFDEYAAIYACFAELVASRRVLVDHQPLRIVADAALIARRTMIEPFP